MVGNGCGAAMLAVVDGCGFRGGSDIPTVDAKCGSALGLDGLLDALVEKLLLARCGAAQTAEVAEMVRPKIPFDMVCLDCPRARP